MSNTNCKNCGFEVTGNYCSNCGQQAHIHKIDAKYFLHDIPHSILHVDKGFPYTFLQLIKRPANAMQEYLDGKRALYFRPFAYVILMSAISSLLINKMRSIIQQVHTSRTGEVIVQHQSFFSHYQSVFIFLMIPIVSLCTWLVFKKFQFNFWENVLINTYLAAQLNVLLVIIQLYSLIKFLITGSPKYSLIIFITCFMTYYALTFSGLMHKQMKPLPLGLRLGLMCFLLASVYATAMSFTGILNPWQR